MLTQICVTCFWARLVSSALTVEEAQQPCIEGQSLFLNQGN